MTQTQEEAIALREAQAAKVIELAKNDYRVFLKIVWPIISGGKAPLTEYELDAAHWAMEINPNRGNRRFIFAHREFGKSTMLTYPGPCWFWLRDPSATGGVYAKNNSKAEEAYTATRLLLNRSPLLKHLEPPDKAEAEAWQKDNTRQFSVRGATNIAVPSYKPMGSTSMSTGGRAMFIFKDDFETLENSSTREARKTTAARSREIDRTARENCHIVNSGTYARDESAFQEMIDDGYEHRIYPILYPTEEEIELATNRKTGECYYAPCVLLWLNRGYDYLGRPTRPGGIIQPERWTPRYVAEKLGKHLAEFRRHYQGIRKSGASDEQPLRLSDLMVEPCAAPSVPDQLKWGTESAGNPTALENIDVDAPGNADCFRKPAMKGTALERFPRGAMWVDTAGTGKDRMAWSSWGTVGGIFYCRGLEGSRLRSETDTDEDRITIEQAYEQILAAVVRFNIGRCVIEEQFGGIFVAQSLRALARDRGIICVFETKHSTGNKYAVCLAIAKPLTYSHLVAVDEAVARNTDFQHEYTRITPQEGCLENDDLIEAFCRGLAVISENQVERSQTDRLMDSAENLRDDLHRQLGEEPPVLRWGDDRRAKAGGRG